MPLIQVVVLAVIQGLTEFLPISSTAHLYLTSWLFGWQAEALDFDIALHLGTLAAVLLYFSGDWIQIIAQAFGHSFGGGDEQLKLNRGLLWLLAIGSIPVGVAGLLFNRQAEGPWRNPYVMGTMLIAVGLFMAWAESRATLQRDLGTVSLSDSAAIGAAQALAVVPGTSRSGITISAGLLRGLDRRSAARFSFLLSTPAIAAAAAKALYDMHKHGGLHAIANMQFAVGVSVSAITGLLVIAWFLHYLRDSNLRLFVYYRIVFGIIVLALAFIRRPA
jgi:undecaprenyl-diphosphatase